MSTADDDALRAALGPLNAGHTLGRYELLAPVGRGGMAVVWAARQSGTRGFSKLVAVKTMLPSLGADPRFERMFLREAELAARVHHPNVCPILDLGEQDGTLYLVMDWVDGESLASLSALADEAGRALPLPVVAHVVAQAARGLHAAHTLIDDAGAPAGVVHRDVSPHNVLVRRDGHVLVVDFGVAKAMESSDHATQSGTIKGKIAYLAPEQAEGRPLDARADVFALGVVLYELATGAHPFRGATDVATLLRISGPEAPPAPVELVDGFPAAFSDLIMRALAKDPAARHRSAGDLARDLDALAAEGGVDAAERTAAFVEELGAPRRAARAVELAEAVELADERRALREAEGDGAALAAPARPSSSRSRTAVIAAVAVAVGVGIGVSAMRSSSATREERSPARPTEPVTLPPAESSPPLPSATAAPRATAARVPTAATSNPAPPSFAVASAPRGTARASVSPVASAPGAPAAPASASSSGDVRFRTPGF